MNIRILRTLAPMIAAGLFEACGGGGGSPTPAPPPPPPAPTVSYTAPPVYTVGTTIAVLTPTTTGSPVAFAVAPSLPAGLLLNAGTGAIGGTPTAPAAQANYTVTATNASGSGTAAVSITVNDVAPSISFP